MPPQEPVTITAVWHRRIGDSSQVLVEIDGQWRLVSDVLADGAYSDIHEGRGVHMWKPDPLTESESCAA